LGLFDDAPAFFGNQVRVGQAHVEEVLGHRLAGGQHVMP
jgi:hypothetical protein